MDALTDQQQAMILRDYSEGRLGTRQAIEKLGLHDYADLIIALAQHDLDLPKPADTPERRRNFEAAWGILEPRLRRGSG